MAPKRWVYLTDLQSQARIMSLDGEKREYRTIYPANVSEKGPIGLRLAVLEETSSTNFRETGEILPATMDLLMEVEDAYTPTNSWIYDWPHYELELSANTIEESKVRAQLDGMMAKHPFDFEIIGIQRRNLWYFSDGNQKSQARFEALIPAPDSFPYRKDGSLRRRYRGNWSSLLRDAKVPLPAEYQKEAGGGLRPMLYMGDSYVVRFKVDGQIPAYEHCRVYVMPDGTFIASDWCQRHDQTSYSQGINLQMGIYTFDSWIVGPCLFNATQRGQFKAKTAVVKREAVRDLIRKGGGVHKIPSIDEALAKATKQVMKDKPVNFFAKLVSDSFDIEKSDADNIDALIAKGQDALKKGEIAKLVGFPILVTKTTMIEQAGNYYTSKFQPAYVPELDAYRFTAKNESACGMAGANVVCTNEYGVHLHWYVNAVTLDTPTLRSAALPLVKAERQARTPKAVVETPITADLLAEALATAKGVAAEKENVLKAAQLAKALQAAQVKATSKVYNHGTVKFEPQLDGSVKILWSNGVSVFHVRPDQKALSGYVTSNELPINAVDEAALELVQLDTALLVAATWYFKEYVPTQVKTVVPATGTAVSLAPAKKVEGTLSSFTYDGNFYRVDVAAGGILTIERLVNGAFQPGLRLKRKSNGHFYQQDDAGEWVVVSKENQELRAAAVYFVKKYAGEHTPVLYMPELEEAGV